MRSTTYNKILEVLEETDNRTIEVALNCQEQKIDDFIHAYYLVVMHELIFN